jgi:hypothetical protein
MTIGNQLHFCNAMENIQIPYFFTKIQIAILLITTSFLGEYLSWESTFTQLKINLPKLTFLRRALIKNKHEPQRYVLLEIYGLSKNPTRQTRRHQPGTN